MDHSSLSQSPVSVPAPGPAEQQQQLYQQLQLLTERLAQQDRINQHLMQQVQQLNVSPAAGSSGSSSSSAVRSAAALQQQAAIDARRLLDKAFKAEAFSNRNDQNIEYWVNDLDRYLSSCTLSDAEQVTYVKLLFRGPVGLWFDSAVTKGVPRRQCAVP